MIAKRERIVFTFPSTAAAMAMETSAKAQGLPGRLIPVPTSITAGCGLAWMAEPGEKETILTMLENSALQYEGSYFVML